MGEKHLGEKTFWQVAVKFLSTAWRFDPAALLTNGLTMWRSLRARKAYPLLNVCLRRRSWLPSSRQNRPLRPRPALLCAFATPEPAFDFLSALRLSSPARLVAFATPEPALDFLSAPCLSSPALLVAFAAPQPPDRTYPRLFLQPDQHFHTLNSLRGKPRGWGVDSGAGLPGAAARGWPT